MSGRLWMEGCGEGCSKKAEERKEIGSVVLGLGCIDSIPVVYR